MYRLLFGIVLSITVGCGSSKEADDGSTDWEEGGGAETPVNPFSGDEDGGVDDGGDSDDGGSDGGGSDGGDSDGGSTGSAPSILILSPAPDTLFIEDSSFSLTATVNDDEDDPSDLVVTGISSLDGPLSLEGSPSESGDWETTVEGLSNGSHTLSLTVTDSDGNTDADSIAIVINGPPSAPVVTISPDPTSSGESLTATVDEDSVDPEGDPITYTYQWVMDGSTVAEMTTDSVPAGLTQRDQYWEVVVTPSDAFHDGDPGTDSVTIGNSPPRIDSVNLYPLTATTVDDLVALPLGWFDQDLDPELYQYEWIINGDIDEDETTDTYPNGKTSKGDNIRVTVTPLDAFEAGEPITSSLLTILNSPPAGGEADITPDIAEPLEPLVCSIVESAWDVDDDAITYSYTWYIDGVEQPEYTTDVVEEGETANLETWMCEIRASDGTEDGEPFSASVYISDGAAPDPPGFDSSAAHRNADNWDLSGYCEAGCTLDFSCEDGITAWDFVETCTPEGTFSITIDPLVRGAITACAATCTDGAGNESGISATVSTEVCDPEDEFENGSYGDSLDDPIDEWGPLADDGSSTLTILGNMLDEDDEDWYVITATDDVSGDIAMGIDLFHFQAELVAGADIFNFVIYRDDPGDMSADSCMPDVDGYTEYSWYSLDIGDGTHAIPSDTRSCGDGVGTINVCEDHTAEYYVHVSRNPSVPPSCESYQLSLTNGVW
jgi:hypothetical protein